MGVAINKSQQQENHHLRTDKFDLNDHYMVPS